MGTPFEGLVYSKRLEGFVDGCDEAKYSRNEAPFEDAQECVPFRDCAGAVVTTSCSSDFSRFSLGFASANGGSASLTVTEYFSSCERGFKLSLVVVTFFWFPNT